MKTPRKTLLSPPSPSSPIFGSRPWIRIKEAFPYLLAFMVVVVLVVFFLQWHIKSSYEEEVLFWQARLTGIADDQAQRVSEWLKERQGDAKDSSTRPSIGAVLRDYNQTGHLLKIPSASQSESLAALDAMATSYSYAGVYILDRDARVVMQSSHSIPLNLLFAESCRAVARSGVAHDELAGDTPSRTLLGFIAPVFSGSASADAGQPTGQPLGLVLLVSDASQTLFPLVTREVIPSRTGETVLVRREGNEVVYFSPLRYISAGSPNLRVPLSAAPTAAKYALEGRQTQAEYKDYRGAPVLAATQGIPRTRWGLVRKIDRAEALEDFHRSAYLESLAAGFLIILVGGLLLILRHYIVTRVRKQEEEKFRALLESAPDAIYIIKPATLRIQGRNRQAQELDGYSDDEISRMYVTDLHPPEDRTIVRESFRRGLEAGGASLAGSLQILRKGGQFVPVEENLTVVNAGGEILGISIVRDITERKRVEMELRESEEHFRSLFENMLNGFAYCQMQFEHGQPQDFTYLQVNHAFETLTGLKNVVGRRVSEVIPGLRKSDPDVFEMYGRVALTGVPERLETFVGAMGMWYSIAAYSPKKEYFVAVFDVITERKQAEAALTAERHLLHSLMDNLPDRIYFKDRDSHFTRINKAHAEQFGLSDPAQAVGKTDFDYFPEERAQRASNDEKEIIRTGQPIVGREGRLDWPDGHVTWFVTTKMPLRDLNGSIIGTFGVSHDITNRKRAEEALSENEGKYRSLVSNIPDVVWTLDANLRFVFISRNIERMSGFSVDEVEHHGADIYLASLHPDDASKVKDGLRSLFAEGRPYDVECRVRRKDGEWIWVHDRAVATYEKNGIRYADGLLSDITERKRAEQELYQSRQMLQSILDTIPQRVFWKDRNTVYLGCNKALAIDAGLKDPAEITGKNDYELVWRESAEVYRADDNLVMEQDTPRLNYEEIQNRPDGSVIWLRTSKLPLHDQEGKVIGVIGTYEDITEQKGAEAEHVRLVTAIEQSAEAVVITNTAAEIEYVNPAFTLITGYSREEVLGKNARVLKSGKHDPEFYRQLWETILTGQTWHGELTNQRKDGSLYTELMTITPVRDEGGKITHFIATKQDVTEHKALEAQLHQAAKMQAVGQLAGGVAHDFNNLLTVINGYSEILIETLASDKKSSSYLKEIHNAGERAASLTRQLLAFSRRQVLAPQVLDLNTVVSNVERMLQRLIGEDIRLHILLSPSLGRVKADPGQIEQVIMNLAVNARDAMPMGGHLTIETSNVELDEEYARNHPTVKPGPHVMLGVSDTGAGMTPETKAHIFEPFFTTKEQGKGTGLGLATVYGIVKQSEGSVWLYSELGQGTVFKIYLPMVWESPAVSEPAETATDSASGTETILLVEDEEGVRSLVRLALLSVGYKVLETQDAESALAICANHVGPIHLLLTDVVMPQMSGPAVASKVAALRPGIRVLYMSGYTDDAVVHHGVLSQEMPFIQKPFSPTALRKKIREVLGRK